MREWLAVLPGILTFLFLLVHAHAVTVRGVSSGGLPFQGTLSGVMDGVLAIRDHQDNPSTEIGVPVSSIDKLSIRLPSEPDNAVSRDLESFVPLLPYLDENSIESLLDYLEVLAVPGSWSESGIWAQRLGKLNLPSELQRRIGLLRARSLHGLGLFRLLEEELDSLARMFAPVEAPPLYCWLKATVLMRGEHFKEARFWARLPFLAIPVSGEPVMQDLGTLIAEIDDRAKSKNPFFR